MKPCSIMLDDESDKALERTASYLRISRSEVVRRLTMLADAAVFWGVQLHLQDEKDPAELKKFARQGCEEWGLFTLSQDWPSREQLAAMRAGRHGPTHVITKTNTEG